MPVLTESEAYEVFSKIASRIAKKHGEVFDTEPRTLACGVLEGRYDLPRSPEAYEMFTAAGNRAIAKAIASYVAKHKIVTQDR